MTLSFEWCKDGFVKSGAGGLLSPKFVCGCACRTSKIWLSLYYFFAQFPTHHYIIFKERTQFDQNWVLFTIICQNTPNLCNLGSISDEAPPPSLYQISQKKKKKKKKAAQKADTYTRFGQYIRRTLYIFWVNLSKFGVIVKLILSNLYYRKNRSVQSFCWAGDPEE